MQEMQRKCGGHPPNIPCRVCLLLLLIKSTGEKKKERNLLWADGRHESKSIRNCSSNHDNLRCDTQQLYSLPHKNRTLRANEISDRRILLGTSDGVKSHSCI